jgi:hypothetical protein
MCIAAYHLQWYCSRVNRLIYLLLLPLYLLPATMAQHQTMPDPPITGGTLPYEVTLREISLAPADLPTLHSMATAQWQGQWILLAGRTSGLHGMTGNNAFDPQFENRNVWVIDPVTKQSWNKSLSETNPASGLTADVVDSLSSVNTQYHQEGERLVIVGGYGYKRSVVDHKTYDTISFIHLPGLIEWVKQTPGTETSLAAQHIKQIRHSYFQVTGGSLEKLDGEYQLIMGQNYDGRYRPNFNGTYTNQVRRFLVAESPDGPIIPSASMLATAPVAEYRRRDLNVATILEATATPNQYAQRAVVYSGVFTPTNGVWTVPVVVAPGGVVTMDSPTDPATLRQGFQVYHSAKVGLFHRASREMHMIMFGGLTVLEYDSATNSFVRDDQVPFTNQCGVVIRRQDGSFVQHFLSTRFPLILSPSLTELRFGTNAEFFSALNVPKQHPKVIDLAAINRETVIGHIFGGIVSNAGNGGSTGASGRVFEVVLTPLTTAPQPQISLTSTDVVLSWQGQAQWDYLIETSTNLQQWTETAAPLSGLTGIMQATFPRDEPKRFFRLFGGTRSLPP